MNRAPRAAPRPLVLVLLLGIAAGATAALGAPSATAAGAAGASAAGAPASRPRAAAADAAPAPAAGPGAASAVYGAARVPLRFDHAAHGALGLGCAFCHDRALTSRSASDVLRPPGTRCDGCHGTDHGAITPRAGHGAAVRCDSCHEGHSASDGARVARVVAPAASLRFDHAAHAARGVSCATCHADAAAGHDASERSLPSMQSCLTCHNPLADPSVRASERCETCHVGTAGGRLRTDLPGGSLRPGPSLGALDHGAEFLRRHRAVAAADSATCATCHTERECLDCHDGRVRPRRVHPNDFLSLHGMAARQNDPTCTSCHRAQTFCVTCHERSGVALSGPPDAAPARGRLHPPKSVFTDRPRGPRHHAWEAQRSLATCASCHAERDCTSCHATAARGGQGGLSPHPPGFGGSGGCRAALERNARPCLTCHSPGDSALQRCAR